MNEEIKEILGFPIEDEWFNSHHVKKLTPAFCKWWIGIYGKPSIYLDDDPHEYYIRMGFALLGWHGHETLEKE